MFELGDSDGLRHQPAPLRIYMFRLGRVVYFVPVGFWATHCIYI